MMKDFRKILAFSLALCLIICALAGCGDNTQSTEPSGTEETQTVDYAGQLKLNMGSSTLKQEATVKSYVDGDTVHFYACLREIYDLEGRKVK